MLDNLLNEYNSTDNETTDVLSRLKTLIEKADMINATDIHINANECIYFRIDGLMVRYEDEIFTIEQLINAIEQLSNFEVYNEDEQDFSLVVKSDKNIYLRCNLYKTSEDNNKSYSLAIRLLPSKIPTMEELNLPQVTKSFLDMKYGLVLISGPTGHGKTTTMASIIEAINQKYCYHIITIEDPIEYHFKSKNSLIHQRQVGYDTESFATGLRAALRQDPDVIVLGELRDSDTIRTALWAAETGHLVFATIHAGNAIETIDKMTQYFPNEQEVIRYSLANSLKGIISQRLYPIRNNITKKICVCDVLFNNNVVKAHIKNNDLSAIKNDLELMPEMVSMFKTIEEYKVRNLI